jgi:arsenate reductase
MDSHSAIAALAALGQETRVRALRRLTEVGASAAGDLQSALNVPASTLSFHLAELEAGGLVRSTRRGRHIIYAAHGAALRDLLSFVAATCTGGRAGLPPELERLIPVESAGGQTMMAAFNVLFLCAHNSARSIMAEAILTQIGGDGFRAYSAGSTPAKHPNPEVIEKLQSFGHDVSRLRSKSWDEFVGPEAPHMDFVIALCDTPDGQRCPEFGPRALTGAWPLPDPSKFKGSAVERAVLLNELYGAIRRRLEIFCSLPFASLERMAVKAQLDDIGRDTAAA